MRAGILFSTALHGGLLAAMFIALPDAAPLQVAPSRALPVELVTIDEFTNLRDIPRPEPTPEPPAEEIAEPELEPIIEIPPEPLPEPEPAPVPEPAPAPEPEPVPEPEPAQEPAPELNSPLCFDRRLVIPVPGSILRRHESASPTKQ